MRNQLQNSYKLVSQTQFCDFGHYLVSLLESLNKQENYLLNCEDKQRELYF